MRVDSNQNCAMREDSVVVELLNIKTWEKVRGEKAYRKKKEVKGEKEEEKKSEKIDSNLSKEEEEKLKGKEGLAEEMKEEVREEEGNTKELKKREYKDITLMEKDLIIDYINSLQLKPRARIVKILKSPVRQSQHFSKIQFTVHLLILILILRFPFYLSL